MGSVPLRLPVDVRSMPRADSATLGTYHHVPWQEVNCLLGIPSSDSGLSCAQSSPPPGWG